MLAIDPKMVTRSRETRMGRRPQCRSIRFYRQRFAIHELHFNIRLPLPGGCR